MRLDLMASVWIAACSLSGCASISAWLEDREAMASERRVQPCANVQPDLAMHPVTVCKSAGRMTVSARGEETVYEMTAAQARLRQELLTLAREGGYPWRTLAGASVSIWLNMPVFDPEAVAITAVVKGPAGNFSVGLPLAPAAWRIDPEQVSWLGGDTYPSLAARRSGVLVVAARADATPARFQAFVRGTGTLAMTMASGLPAVTKVQDEGLLLRLETVPFAEDALRQHLLAQRLVQRFVQEIRFEPAIGGAGRNVLLWQFPFVAP